MRVTGLVLLLAAWAGAQHGETKAFEEWSRDLRESTRGLVRHERLDVHWGADGKALYYRAADGTGWVRVAVEDGARERVEQRPKDAAKGRNPAERRRDGGRRERQEGRPGHSPDGQWQARVVDGAVEVSRTEGDAPPVRLAIARPDGWVLENRIQWSPAGDRFVVWRRPDHPVREVHYVRSSPEDRLQPEHFTNRYPKPGDDLNVARPVVCHVDGREPLALDERLVPHPFSISDGAWREDGRHFTCEFIERGFGVYRVLEIDSGERRQRVVVEERSETFIHVYGKAFRHDLRGGEEILWLSERDGWNHLYLMDGATGTVKRRLTSGEWVVRRVAGVDEEQREVLLQVGGIDPAQDPYHVHWVRVGIDDGEVVRLTAGDGTHELEFSPDGNYYVDSFSRVDLPPVHELRRSADGSLVTVLERADATALLESGWRMPERFVAKDRFGNHDIHGLILRPRDFDASRRYPVVEKIYAGPHDSFVPKSWRTWHGGASEVCEAGFIVVQIDGLGTSNRSRDFHHFCYKNLMDSGLPDRIRWIRAAAAEAEPAMDLGRVGIYGGSAGGQSTLAALLNHGDFYRAGAADCGCHDNRMDKIWWNEQWMDWPVGPHYAANSNVTHAAKLRGDLLLTVGEVDTNVDPSSTMQVVDALIRADRDFDLVVVPNGGHGVGETPYLRRKRIAFFRDALAE